jgi:hypothetical protein
VKAKALEWVWDLERGDVFVRHAARFLSMLLMGCDLHDLLGFGLGLGDGLGVGLDAAHK